VNESSHANVVGGAPRPWYVLLKPGGKRDPRFDGPNEIKRAVVDVRGVRLSDDAKLKLLRVTDGAISMEALSQSPQFAWANGSWIDAIDNPSRLNREADIRGWGLRIKQWLARQAHLVLLLALDDDPWLP